MFSPCSGDVFIRVFTVISWRDHWQTRVHNMRQFYTGGGREPVIIFWWLLWFWCGHSAVTPDQSPRLHFKSVCHEHHQVTLTWNQRCVTSVTWMGSTLGSFFLVSKNLSIFMVNKVLVISLFSDWMLLMATKVGLSAPGLEAWAAGSPRW